MKLAKTYDFCAEKEPKLTVVLIHGIASDSTTFQKALAYFQETAKLKAVRFVTFDLLGAGKSSKDNRLNFDYADQLTALHNSIAELNLTTPLILVGHSMGTFIVTRYTQKYPEAVRKLILVSPPIYTEKDFSNPAFATGIKIFEETVSLKNRDLLGEKAFRNSMTEIVLDRKNYQVLAELKTPATLIYGELDQFIAAYNIPKILQENPRLTAIKTAGRHGVTRDKYTEIAKILKEEVDAKTI